MTSGADPGGVRAGVLGHRRTGDRFAACAPKAPGGIGQDLALDFELIRRFGDRAVLLGGYETASGRRSLMVQRRECEVRLYDIPLIGRGRCYLVEAGFGTKSELAGLVADYKRQARLLGRCPMERGATAGRMGPER